MKKEYDFSKGKRGAILTAPICNICKAKMKLVVNKNNTGASYRCESCESIFKKEKK